MGPKNLYPALALAILTTLLLPIASALDSWPMFRHDLQNTGHTEAAGDLNEILESWKHQFIDGIYSSPAVGDIDNDGQNEILVGCDDGKLYALGHKGETIWEFATAKNIHSSPALADLDGDGQLEIVFGAMDGRILALDNKGGIFWSYTVNAAFRSSPKVFDIDGDNNLEVVIGSENGTVYSLDGESGLLEWSFDTGTGVFSSPAIGKLYASGEDNIVVGSQDGAVYVLYGNGTKAWSFNTTQEIYSSPALSDVTGDGIPDVVVGSDSGYVYALQAGKVLWKTNLGGPIKSSPTVADLDGDGRKEILVGVTIEKTLHGKALNDEKNRLYALSPSKGEEVWSFDTGGWPIFSSPVSGDINRDGEPEVVFGTTNGKVYALDNEGKQIWSYTKGTGFYSSPVLADVDSDGDLEVLLGFYYSNELVLLDGLKKPDLMIKSIKLSREIPYPNETINITLEVFNDGDAEAKNFIIDVYRRSPVLDHGIGRANVTLLGAGASESVNITWTTELPDNKLSIYATVDEDDAVEESDETNNDAERPIKQDMTIVGLTVPEKSFAPGEEIEITATIQNLGTQRAENVEVKLLLKNDTEEEILESRIVPEIKPRDSSTVSFVWKYKESSQDRLLLARLDPENKFDELNETNNEASAELLAPPPEKIKPKNSTVQSKESQNPIVILALLGVIFVVLWKKVLSKKIKLRKSKPKGTDKPKDDKKEEKEGGKKEEPAKAESEIQKAEPQEPELAQEQSPAEQKSGESKSMGLLEETLPEETTPNPGVELEELDQTPLTGDEASNVDLDRREGKPSVDEVLGNLMKTVRKNTASEIDKVEKRADTGAQADLGGPHSDGRFSQPIDEAPSDLLKDVQAPGLERPKKKAKKEKIDTKPKSPDIDTENPI
ncbi:MAG: PQQ-binding-like beta-propeller repeat protein [Candidatus Altiarchaeota archaeon]|nr:PQQ-binding-like beta-propeller repeat protein [Candidatus Altiarchaeota archaeon]